MEEQNKQSPGVNVKQPTDPAEKDGAQAIFRKESLDRISSPDQLNDYIQVANPSVWIIIAAVILLLAGLLVWSALGTVETTVRDVFVVENGVGYGYLADARDVAPGMQVRFAEAIGQVSTVSDQPRSSREIGSRYDDYTLHMLGIEDWDYEITVSLPGMEDGLAEGIIVTGKTKPVSFIFN